MFCSGYVSFYCLTHRTATDLSSLHNFLTVCSSVKFSIHFLISIFLRRIGS